jgi:hypothetical protein
MQRRTAWPDDANIIEFDPASAALAAHLEQAGFCRYLAVTTSDRAARRVAGDARFAGRTVHVGGRGCIRHNNADVLILNGASARAMAYSRGVRHAQWVAVPLTGPASAIGVFIGIVQWILRTFERPRLIRVSPEGALMAVFRVRKRRRPGARRYVPAALGVEGFFRRLDATSCRYAVLRWFHDLPAVGPGEDVDLLVDDAAMDTVSELLNSGPGLQAVDLYSTTGLPGTDFRGLPYFPPPLALQLLDGVRIHRGLYRVPNPLHHFLSMTYHALYHKGDKSGLAESDDGSTGDAAAEHDYREVLEQLALSAGYGGPIAMAPLDELLQQSGWRPSHDMLARLARFNPWLRRRLSSVSQAAEDEGLAVFLLREAAASRGGVSRAVQLLQGHGFHVLHTVELTGQEADEAALGIRGGNWGRGPWPLSGGPPYAAIVAYDPAPRRPSRRQQKAFPFVRNARVLCKSAIRDEFNRGVPKDELCNVVHSSDNAQEAREYLAIVWPEGAGALESRIADLRSAASTQSPALADWTKGGRRARIEVVLREGRIAVKKTFKPGMERFWRRETRALGELCGVVPQCATLLAADCPWLVMPCYNDVLRYRRSSGKLLPLAVAREAIDALRGIYEAGYALLDASVDNLLVDRAEGLKLIDFEFCHKYEILPERFEECWDVVGHPAEFAGDLPIQGSNTYTKNWRPYTGLSLESLLHDPAWLQHLKRAAFYTLRAHRYLPRRIRHSWRALRSLVLLPELSASMAPHGGDFPTHASQQPGARRAA